MKYLIPLFLLMICACGPQQMNNPDYKNVSDFIKVDSPQPFEVVSGVLRVEGEARGNYFFEANFPIEIELENGDILKYYATADGEWMTAEFVPFHAEINLSNLAPQQITLKLIQANPSDEIGNEMVMKIPLIVE